ncbi:MAG: hypothetical protein C4293_07760 [Nitrospiraceae bacterium]
MDRATPTIETPASPENQCADVSSAVNSLHVDWLSTESGSTQEKRQQEKRTGPKMTRKRLTVYLPVALLDRLRDAVYWTQDLTLAGLIEKAVARLSTAWRDSGGCLSPVGLKNSREADPSGNDQQSQANRARLREQRSGCHAEDIAIFITPVPVSQGR